MMAHSFQPHGQPVRSSPPAGAGAATGHAPASSVPSTNTSWSPFAPMAGLPPRAPPPSSAEHAQHTVSVFAGPHQVQQQLQHAHLYDPRSSPPPPPQQQPARGWAWHTPARGAAPAAASRKRSRPGGAWGGHAPHAGHGAGAGVGAGAGAAPAAFASSVHASHGAGARRTLQAPAAAHAWNVTQQREAHAGHSGPRAGSPSHDHSGFPWAAPPFSREPAPPQATTTTPSWLHGAAATKRSRHTYMSSEDGDSDMAWPGYNPAGGFGVTATPQPNPHSAYPAFGHVAVAGAGPVTRGSGQVAMVSVRVKALNGRVHRVQVPESESTVEALVNTLEEKFGCPRGQVRLVHRGKVMSASDQVKADALYVMVVSVGATQDALVLSYRAPIVG